MCPCCPRSVTGRKERYRSARSQLPLLGGNLRRGNQLCITLPHSGRSGLHTCLDRPRRRQTDPSELAMPSHSTAPAFCKKHPFLTRSLFSLALLASLALRTPGQEIIRPIAAFDGERSENLESVTGSNFVIRETIDVFQGDVTFRSLANPPGTSIHLWGGSCLGSDCARPRSGRKIIGATTAQAIDFNIPVVRFGAYFTNISSEDHATATFFDRDGGLLGTAHVHVPVAGTLWYWNGWESDVPLGRIELRSNGFLEGFIWLDDLEMDAVPEATCATRNGSEVNPSEFSCTAPARLGSTWQSEVSPIPSVGQSTVSTVVILGFGGPTDGIRVPAGEILILPPARADLALGNHSFEVPLLAALSGATIHTQAARMEMDGSEMALVLLNGIDLTIGF